jgi:hypothetical protein
VVSAWRIAPSTTDGKVAAQALDIKQAEPQVHSTATTSSRTCRLTHRRGTICCRDTKSFSSVSGRLLSLASAVVNMTNICRRSSAGRRIRGKGFLREKVSGEQDAESWIQRSLYPVIVVVTATDCEDGAHGAGWLAWRKAGISSNGPPWLTRNRLRGVPSARCQMIDWGGHTGKPRMIHGT